MKIAKTFRFEAAHALTRWPKDHKCHNVHGHSYKVEVAVSGMSSINGEYPGAIIDFGEIGEWWKTRLHARLDHRLLNDVFASADPTAENLATWIAGEFRRWKFSREVQLAYVRVWETEDSYAEVSS